MVIESILFSQLEVSEEIIRAAGDMGFEETQVTKKEDGSFIVTINYPKDEWLYGYLLSYGPYAKVLEPIEIKEIIKERLKRAMEKYTLEE